MLEREKGPIETTGQLIEVIKRAIPMKFQKTAGHPAKRTFQAIRIEVNNELGVLEETIAVAAKHLKKGGIIACDNVLSHEAKCKPFIDAINAHPDYENVVLPLPAGLSLGRKIKG